MSIQLYLSFSYLCFDVDIHSGTRKSKNTPLENSRNQNSYVFKYILQKINIENEVLMT